MSGQWPRGISLAAASDYFFILVDSGQKTGIKGGVSRLASRDLRLCLKTPQAFRERLERKLHFACGRD
ncbi:hypothetical protein B5F17_10680 [Butyricicoccus pullicaecorum]|uniref:Uncharacterized protein n=1 Tax=Butyricicoccus pullicaecorum TaxID=501571 RepID=A0A1Y4L5Q9_9FIRM|nr:hypothetical protein [Butyricicoccus pullicaecorum]OUP52103.1 hypothetical protein B5F17_10680 [Butyricicoccus pullicaecorum]